MESGDFGVILLQLAIAVIMGFWAKSIYTKKGRSPGWGFVIGFILGIIGVIICSVVKPAEGYRADPATLKTDETTCPHCLETIKIGAKVCKHCGANLDNPI